MQRVANKPVKLSVIMVSVVMLNVAALYQAGAAFKPLIFGSAVECFTHCATAVDLVSLKMLQ
jgi:hypothetical protein